VTAVSEVARSYAAVAAGFEARLRGVGTGQWASPSPCREWTAADVVDHVILTHRRVLGSLRGTEAEPLSEADDRLACWVAARRDVEAALADPAQASATVGGMFGEQPFESLVGRLLCADTLFHTWDLARATGQDDRLDPAAVERAIEFLTPIDEAIRRPGGFGPKIVPPDGADVQTRLLNFGGRTV
jgi:uncharacterized protein (TIGR03086 family)